MRTWRQGRTGMLSRSLIQGKKCIRIWLRLKCMGNSFANKLWERKQCVGVLEPDRREDRILCVNAARTGMLGKLVNKILSLMKRKKHSENGGPGVGKNQLKCTFWSSRRRKRSMLASISPKTTVCCTIFRSESR